MRSTVAASFVTLAAADYSCPGGTWLTHAGLRMTSTANSDCDTVKAEMLARVNGENGWYDQHNRGTYTQQSYGGDLSFSRLTGDGKYTDKMNFVFTDQGGKCKIEGCSEAQVFSIADFSTNYCEQKLLYCGSDEGCNVANSDFTHTEDEKRTMAGATTNFGDCLKVEEVDKQAEIEKAVEITLPWLTNSCSNKGHCGNAYQACCIGFQVDGFPCGCHLADGGNGASVGDCGDCGAAYQLCCAGYAATGNACTCDVSEGGVAAV